MHTAGHIHVACLSAWPPRDCICTAHVNTSKYQYQLDTVTALPAAVYTDLQPVADPEDHAGGRTGTVGCAPSGCAGDRAPPAGVSGGKSPRSWSINAFCVMVEAFS